MAARTDPRTPSAGPKHAFILNAARRQSQVVWKIIRHSFNQPNNMAEISGVRLSLSLCPHKLTTLYFFFVCLARFQLSDNLGLLFCPLHTVPLRVPFAFRRPSLDNPARLWQY
jgi:hypothetical protein